MEEKLSGYKRGEGDVKRSDDREVGDSEIYLREERGVRR